MRSILCALLLCACPFMASALPNDCTIVATEARAELSHVTAWCEIINLTYLNLHDGHIYGHSMAVWQVHPKGAILVYDQDGTLELSTNSRSISDILAALQEKWAGDVIVLGGHFLK